MSRQSGDEIRNGRVYNGFDYSLQVWVRDGIVMNVGLGAAEYAGRVLASIPGADDRSGG